MRVERLGIHESVRTVFPPEELVDHLADSDPEVEVVPDDDVDRCDALVTFAYEDLFLDCGLGWLHSIQSGVDQFPFDELESNDIVLTNSTGIHTDSVGETVTGYMLMFARLLHRYRWSQRDRVWDRPNWNEPYTLEGSSLCVVGLGTLGVAVAERASALGMDVSGVKRTVEPVRGVDRVYPPDELETAIADSRFVALAVPLTDETRRLIGNRELETMRQDACLINVSRGHVVDQDALVEALRAEEIAGAALDVFETEPLPSESPLWEMENVIVTPHTAAHTRDYYARVGEILRDNLSRLSTERSLQNRVV